MAFKQQHLMTRDGRHQLTFEGGDITISEQWSGFVVGHAERQEDQYLLIGYRERSADCMNQVEVTYVDGLADIIRWVNAGLPANWDASQPDRHPY